ncbi:protein NRT1/ PTR FAMILY 1.1-like [Typha latifolia]|uniref:protein NRT1/ PTR FAMILY 1.1-like n=1 Tax=Typha latifolia TaxID=4733 RepID=UPI003C30847F
MEIPADHFEETPQQTKKKGGLKTIPFIVANEIFERVASSGLHANMIIYLTKIYHMSSATGLSVLYIWGAVTNFLPIFGAFLSDSYLGRFKVIAIGSVVSLIGMVLLLLTATLPTYKKPPYCRDDGSSCLASNASIAPWQFPLLFSAFAFMSVGAGGIRPCSLAFGADQLNQKNNPHNERRLQSFFNWYYTSLGISIVIAVTVVVYIQEKDGWPIGFGVSAALMLLSVILFLLGSPLYIKLEGDKSMLSGLLQVIVASLRNRRLALPPPTTDGQWYHSKSKLKVPSEKLRFLNKACIIRNPEKDLNSDGSASNPWSLSTVEQVEDLKSAIRVIPLWSTGIMTAVVINQQSLPVLQAGTMDRHLGSHFQIPAASFSVFAIITITVWVAIYDRVVVPRLAKITGRPRGLGLKQRMGIGLMLLCVATAVAASVERVRRRTAIEQGLAGNGKGMVNMSAMWLVPQYCLTGLAEAFNIIGQIEFYYSEFPKSMASIGISMFSFGMGVGNLVGTLIVQLIEKVSKGGGRVGWLDNNLNKGHCDYYYWFIAFLCVVNCFYFLLCSRAYGEEGENRVWEEREVKEELQSGSA